MIVTLGLGVQFYIRCNAYPRHVPVTASLFNASDQAIEYVFQSPLPTPLSAWPTGQLAAAVPQ